MNDHDDQQRYNFGRTLYNHQHHQHQQFGELTGHSPHEAMDTSSVVPIESLSPYARLKLKEDERFFATFPQARHAPTYSSGPFCDSTAWQLSGDSSGANIPDASAWNSFVSPFPDYRIAANAASLNSAKPVALFYDRKEGGQSGASSQLAEKKKSDQAASDSGATSNTDIAHEVKSNQRIPVSGHSRTSQFPEGASPAGSHNRHTARKDAESPLTRLSFEQPIETVSTDQLLSPISPVPDTPSGIPATPPDHRDSKPPPQKHIRKKIKIERRVYTAEGPIHPRQHLNREPCTSMPSQSTGNLYPQPGGFSTPRGIPLVPLASSSKRTMSKKPPLACHFCRGRKIACGAPDPCNLDRTCNQCQRRGLVCVYPTESRRGLRKKKSPIAGLASLNIPGTKVKVSKKTKSRQDVGERSS